MACCWGCSRRPGVGLGDRAPHPRQHTRRPPTPQRSTPPPPNSTNLADPLPAMPGRGGWKAGTSTYLSSLNVPFSHPSEGGGQKDARKVRSCDEGTFTSSTAVGVWGASRAARRGGPGAGPSESAGVPKGPERVALSREQSPHALSGRSAVSGAVRIVVIPQFCDTGGAKRGAESAWDAHFPESAAPGGRPEPISGRNRTDLGDRGWREDAGGDGDGQAPPHPTRTRAPEPFL